MSYNSKVYFAQNDPFSQTGTQIPILLPVASPHSSQLELLMSCALLNCVKYTLYGTLVYTPVSSSFAALACPALFGSTDEELAARHSLPPRSYFVILHMRLTRSTKDRVKGVRLLTRCAYYPGARFYGIHTWHLWVYKLYSLHGNTHVALLGPYL